MAGNADNIIIGAATLYLNGVDVGFTKDGIEITFEREYVDVMADQALGIVKKGKKHERMTVKTTLLEITLDRLRIAWDQPSANIATVGANTYYYFGYQTSCDVNEHTLRIVGSSPGCDTREFFLYRVVGVSEAPYKMERENEVGLTVEFECLKDPDFGNKFGYVFDY
jgi:hypothetical protein